MSPNKDVVLTPHFTLAEFKGELCDLHINNFLTLCLFCLEPVREEFGEVTITSGYRTKEHNASIPGASPTSQHVKAEACDFTTAADKYDVFEFIDTELKWPGQLFTYHNKPHIHIALPRLGIIPTHKVLEV